MMSLAIALVLVAARGGEPPQWQYDFSGRQVTVETIKGRPGVTLVPWAEDAISLEYSGSASLRADSGPKATADDYEMQWVRDGELMRWLFVHAKPPASNVHELQLGGNWEDFHYFYQQPWPSPEAFTRDSEPWLRQTWPDGSVSERPRRADGSYAVYHRSKRDNGYATGKAGHIYVPRCTDAAGHVAWCALEIDTETGLIRVTRPAEFMADAEYPVTVNDTFGYSSAGASSQVHHANWFVGMSGSPAANGTATTIHAYIRNDSAKMWTAGLYNSDASTLIEDTDEYASPGGGAQADATFTLDSPTAVSSGTTYTFGLHAGASASLIYYDDTPDEGWYNTSAGTYSAGSMPASISLSGPWADKTLSLWVEYTPTGDGSTPQIITIYSY